MNDIRVDFVRGLGDFGVTETRGETVGKSTPRGGVSSAGEGVLAIGTPSSIIKALRKLGDGGEPEICPGTKGEREEVGSVADLRRFCVLERSSGNGTWSRLRVDLDRLCITPLPEFWVKFEGRAFGFRLALEVGGAAVVIAGVRTGEARIGVNGVNLNGEANPPRALRMTSSLLCVFTLMGWGAGWSESSRNRGAEGLSSSVGTGIEWTSVAIPRAKLAANRSGLGLGSYVRVR